MFNFLELKPYLNIVKETKDKAIYVPDENYEIYYRGYVLHMMTLMRKSYEHNFADVIYIQEKDLTPFYDDDAWLHHYITTDQKVFGLYTVLS